MVNAVVIEYRIPRKEDKLEVLTLESPVFEKDVELIIKWIGVLKDTLIDEQKNEIEKENSQEYKTK